MRRPGRHALVTAAGDLVVGLRCAGCATPGVLLCGTCRTALRSRPRPCWPDPCPAALRTPVSLTPWSATTYAGVPRRVLIEFKEHRRESLAPYLAAPLAVAVRSAVTVPPVGWTLVPVASRRASVRARGYDAVLLLTRLAARRLRRDGHDVLVTQSLRHGRRVDDQAGLTAQQRYRNLDGALRSSVRRWPPGRGVIVVDDVITTGATLGAAVTALRAAGADVRGCAVLAATPKGTP